MNQQANQRESSPRSVPVHLPRQVPLPTPQPPPATPEPATPEPVREVPMPHKEPEPVPAGGSRRIRRRADRHLLTRMEACAGRRGAIGPMPRGSEARSCSRAGTTVWRQPSYAREPSAPVRPTDQRMAARVTRRPHAAGSRP